MENSKNKKIGLYSLIIVIVIVVIILLCKCCQSNNIASYFDNIDEDWKVIGDAQEGDAKPNYYKNEGNPGGYISADDDAAGGVWYWSAPKKFLGDKSSAYGKKLEFSLKQSSVENQFDADDVVLVGNEFRIAFNTPQNPGVDWTDYSIKLDEHSGWKLNDVNGNVLSKEDFVKVLSKLTAIYIRGEFIEGEDTGGLDSVVLYLK